ncbi:MAG: ABC transporter ATP-binding protein [Thiohalocapsa sp.]|nr:ABC transporter ATP-binding protein [Thiohalocapsa sp.]MCF7992115.1 ABC transporter ATP-binding protein [Thiohalocapsa sp.]
MAAPTPTHDATTLISLDGVGVAFRGGQLTLRPKPPFWVLKDVTFDLRQGETLGVIGRNAAGKSTLLRLLAGIIAHDRGNIINHGHSTALLSLQTGFVPHLSGRQNAILSGILLGLRRREVEARMDAIIEFSELGDFIDEPLSNYSSGMRSRLGFSVAYQVEPDILLIDETLSVGDEEFQAKSSRAMHERIRSDKTIVLVSHSAATITALCDRAVWIDNGISREVGNVDDVTAAYRAELAQRDTSAPTGAPRRIIRSKTEGVST